MNCALRSKIFELRQQCIRERAFEIWVEEGQPHGRDREHWVRATREITADGNLTQSEGSPPLQPLEPIGEIKHAEGRLVDQGEGIAPGERRD
jgi:Protein of unknown function (DUF2934)